MSWFSSCSSNVYPSQAQSDRADDSVCTKEYRKHSDAALWVFFVQRIAPSVSKPQIVRNNPNADLETSGHVGGSTC